MKNTAEQKPESKLSRPSGKAIIKAIKAAGVKFVVAVPDIVTSEGLLWPLYDDADINLVKVCKEDEGVSICAAMSYSETRAILLMQQTGFMDSLNAIRAIGVDYRLPVCMMIGLQGKEEALLPEQSQSYGVRIIQPIMEVMALSHSLIEESQDINNIVSQINKCYERSRPHCFLVGRSPGE